MTPRRVMFNGQSRALSVTFAGFQASQEEAFVGFLNTLWFIVPPWCTSLFCKIQSSGDDDAVMRISTSHDYRQASLKIDPRLFDDHYDDHERMEYLTHELIHIALCPMSDFMLDALNRFTTKDEALRGFVLGEFMSRVDRTTQDLARSIFRHPNFNLGGTDAGNSTGDP